MSKLDLQYDLANLTPASASPPQANFTRIEQHVNQELVERDGTVAMRAQLKLVGDPVAELDAAPKQYVDAVLPVGIIMMYGGAGAPPGGRWAVCNGAELQTSEYPELFAVLGAAYGGTSGRFNLPNFTDRFPRGATPGTVGGTADAVVTNHTHPIDHIHALGTTYQDFPDHGHIGADHLHGVNIQSGGQSSSHFHTPAGGGNFVTFGVGIGQSAPGGNVLNQATSTDWANQDHSHNVNGQTGAADRQLNTQGASARHQHQFQPPTFSGPTGQPSGGVDGVGSNVPPFVGVTYIVRVR